MKLYLSSYEIGNKGEKLIDLAPKKTIGYIPNARDYTPVDLARKVKRTSEDMQKLTDLGFQVEMLDLRDFFGETENLRNKLNSLGSVFVSGGNTFILRQAMLLSGMDIILEELKKTDFCYAGYSAGGCVLAPNLRSYSIVDDATQTPYEDCKETIWEGLNFVDFAFMPHWDSDHPESADVEKEIDYCISNNIKYRAIRDGEVIIMEIGI